MLAESLCNYVKEEGINERLCKVSDDTALAVDLGIKPTLMLLLQAGYNWLMFYEERVSSEGKIIVRAVPKGGM